MLPALWKIDTGCGKLGKTRPDHLGQGLSSVHGQIQTFSKPGGSATGGTHIAALCICSEMIISELTRVMGDEDQQGQMLGLHCL